MIMIGRFGEYGLSGTCAESRITNRSLFSRLSIALAVSATIFLSQPGFVAVLQGVIVTLHKSDLLLIGGNTLQRCHLGVDRGLESG